MFDKYNLTEQGFDLRDVIVDPEAKDRFIERVKLEIENDPKSTPTRKRELWAALKKSYSPVLFSALWLM